MVYASLARSTHFTFVDDLGSDDEGDSLLSRSDRHTGAGGDFFASSHPATQANGSADDGMQPSAQNYTHDSANNPDELVFKQKMSNMLASFLSLGSANEYPSIFDSSTADCPNNLLLPTSYEARDSQWLSRAYYTFMEWPGKLKLAVCLLFSIQFILTILVEFIITEVSTSTNRLFTSPATAAMASSELASSTVAPSLWNAPYLYLENHQYIPHIFTSLIPHLVAWVLTCPFYATVFQYMSHPAAFDVNAMVNVASPSHFMLPGRSAPFCASYRFALSKLWWRSIPVFFAYYVPFMVLRVIFIGWVYVLVQTSILAFLFLFCLFAGFQLALSMFFLYVMPLFVDHPCYPIGFLLMTSYHLVQRNLFGSGRFVAMTSAIIAVGWLLMLIGSFPAWALVNIAVAFAYKDILGISSWSTPASFAWQRDTPRLLGLNCEPAQLYNSNNLGALIGLGYQDPEMGISDVEDDVKISYPTSKFGASGANKSSSSAPRINFDFESEGTGVTFTNDSLDL